jgi:hypothetical protein
MRRGRSFAVIATAVALVTASCEEHFPVPLVSNRVARSVELPDATADASSDADSLTDGTDTVADAGVDDGVDAAGSGVCNVRLAAPTIAASPHVSEGSAVAYASNPPSSGPHYPSWANFQEFAHPVDDGYLVHSMEHGAVLLLYKCADDGGSCSDMIAQLRAVRDAVPTDPLCDPGIRVRVILAPRSANDAAVTAAAWGNTYRADCVDAPSLAAFITAHYAHGPEDFCFPGSVF